MQSAFLGGLAIAIVAGFLNGAFALPLRYARNWEWENTWLIFSCFSLILLPWVAAFCFVPHFQSMIHGIPLSYYVPGIIAGFFWGISFVLYGIGRQFLSPGEPGGTQVEGAFSRAKNSRGSAQRLARFIVWRANRLGPGIPARQGCCCQ
jgi:hypothetical protein